MHQVERRPILLVGELDRVVAQISTHGSGRRLGRIGRTDQLTYLGDAIGAGEGQREDLFAVQISGGSSVSFRKLGAQLGIMLLQ